MVSRSSGVLLVRDVMTQDIKTVEASSTVEEAVQKMNRFSIGSVIVTDAGRRRPLGILTERDILRLVEHYPDPLILKVRDVMSRPVATVRSDVSIEEAALEIAENRIKRLPVIKDERLVGIITSSDIVRASPSLVKALTHLIKGGRAG